MEHNSSICYDTSYSSKCYKFHKDYQNCLFSLCNIWLVTFPLILIKVVLLLWWFHHLVEFLLLGLEFMPRVKVSTDHVTFWIGTSARGRCLCEIFCMEELSVCKVYCNHTHCLHECAPPGFCCADTTLRWFYTWVFISQLSNWSVIRNLCIKISSKEKLLKETLWFLWLIWQSPSNQKQVLRINLGNKPCICRPQ